MTENNNMYVNVTELQELLECIKQENPQHREIINEINELILDLKWREINE